MVLCLNVFFVGLWFFFLEIRGVLCGVCLCLEAVIRFFVMAEAMVLSVEIGLWGLLELYH